MEHSQPWGGGGGSEEKPIRPLCQGRSVKREARICHLLSCGPSSCQSACFSHQWRGCLPRGHGLTLTFPALRAAEALSLAVVVAHEGVRVTFGTYTFPMVLLAWLSDGGACVRGKRVWGPTKPYSLTPLVARPLTLPIPGPPASLELSSWIFSHSLPT